MKVRLLLVGVFVVTGLVVTGLDAFAAGRELKDKRYAPIVTYYSSCSYVAANSSPAEVARFVGMLRRSETPRFSLLDIKGRRVYAAIAATQGVILNPDPGIFAGLLPTIEYYFTTTPMEIVQAGKDTVSVRVKRVSTWPVARFAQPTGPGPSWLYGEGQFPGNSAAPGDPRTDGPRRFVFIEIDEWVQVEGTWRLHALHAYPV